MSSALTRFNALPSEEAQARLLACCGSHEWARQVTDARPFRDAEDLAAAADRVWRSLSRNDWLEAFAAHPRIGEKKGTDPFSEKKEGEKKGTDPFSEKKEKKGTDPFSARFSAREQVGTRSASPETLANLADANRDYEERFGHIFIVCATGKSAAEMLALLEARLHNDPKTELATAAEEQRKILQLRLAKLLESEGT